VRLKRLKKLRSEEPRLDPRLQDLEKCLSKVGVTARKRLAETSAEVGSEQGHVDAANILQNAVQHVYQ